MNHDLLVFLVLLVCLAIIAILAGLLYAASRAHMAAFTSIGELRSSLDKIHLDNEKIHHAIQLQKPVLYDAHKRISAVIKGLEKPAC